MRKVNVREARQHIGRLLDAVTTGEEIIIIRRGKPAAKLLKAGNKKVDAHRFPSRHELRAKLSPNMRPSTELIREIRNERD